ncbi:cell division protein FtsQ/DivIB [Candidatus Thiosymbion oneisti]|uniref:cell division protein FtsQ/DivIB n=1 Tax=Candidatus Thiosymbion oneisti TaxID=589554 RepID=UPI00114C8919|nr:cell division protein FtsQ/DivIB [Candidatus Thiosymbion oneisti]
MSSPEQRIARERRAEEPALGRRLMRWVWALGLLSLLGGGGYLLMRWEPQRLPVRVVTVDGALRHLSSHYLRETVSAQLNGGILTQDLVGLKRAVEAIPWVRSASLRRRWPDRLELTVVERVAVARWDEDTLVDADGVIFRPEAGDIPRGLPRLSGMDQDALQLVKRLVDWEPRLRALGLEIETLARDARGAWTLRLSAGFSLALGKERVQERILRFIRVYPRLAATGVPSLMDMRYSNGLAVRWVGGEGDAPGPDAVGAVRSAKLKSRTSGPSRSRTEC